MTDGSQSGQRQPTSRARARCGPRIQVAPETLDHLRPTLLERIRIDARVGLPGLAISFTLHAVLLLIMAVLVVRVLDRREEDAILLSWLTGPGQAREPQPESELKLDSFEVVRRTESTGVIPKPDEDVSQSVEAVPGSVAPVEVRGMLEGRRAPRRDALLNAAGGNERTRAAIESAIFWLKRQQLPEGNWKLEEGYPDPAERVLRTDTGATALALLCLLGAGNSHQTGDHADAVRRGLRWLVDHQKPDGDYHAHIELGRQTAYYAHSQATIAVCEAYALTADPELEGSAERAVRFLLRSQHPTIGGWRYQPQNAETMGDLSVTGWALMALHTARMAGMDVADEPFQRAARFLDAVQLQGGALYCYQPGAPPSVAMTAEGLLSRMFLGWPRSHPALREGLQYLQLPEHAPRWDAGRRNVYEWYYVGNVLHNVGGTYWQDWYRSVQQLIVDHQLNIGGIKPGRDIRGSWHPMTPPGAAEEYSHNAGRLYLTAMCTLILELPFRHRPLYAPDALPAPPQ